MTAIAWDFPDPFSIEVVVQQELIDGFGHVSNVHFIQWLTDCAWAHSAAVGLPQAACVEMQRGMAIREIHVELLASAYAGDRLLVGNWIASVERKLRATRRYQIVNAASGQTLLRGYLQFVCMNLANGRPVRMPPEFLERYTVAPAFKV